MALTQKQVSELYVAIFNRASEGEGNTFWQTKEATSAATADAMLATPDAKEYFGTALDDNQDFIEHIYKNTLNKTYADDKAGIDYWVSQIAAGKSRGEVVAELVYAVSTYKDSTDPVTKAAYDQFNNRVEVSNYMANTVEKAPEDYATSTKFATSGTTGLVVTNSASTVDTAKTSVNTLKPVDGTTFTLTANADVVVGTSQSDVINAAAGTLDGDDVITDPSKSDNDTLNAVYNATTIAAAGTPTISGIENINVNIDAFSGTAAGTTATFDATNVTGSTITLSSAKLGFDGTAHVANAGANNVTAGANVTELTVDDLSTGKVNTGTAKTVAVEVDDAKTLAANLTVNANIDDLQLTTAGGANLKTVNITATDAVVLTAGAALFGTNMATTTVINVDGDVTLKGAGGDLNTINVKNVGTGTVKAEINGATAAADLSKAEVSEITLSTTNAYANEVKFLEGATVTAKGTVGAATFTNGAEFVSQKQGSELTINLAGETIGAAIIKGFQNTTINIAQDVAVTSVTATKDGLTSDMSVAFVGDGDVTFTAQTDAAVLDASGINGDLTYASVSGNTEITVKGGTGSNSITAADDVTMTYIGQNGGDTIDADTTTGILSVETGSGKDTLNITALTTGKILANLGAGDDLVKISGTTATTTGTLILDGGAGSDTLRIDNTSAVNVLSKAAAGSSVTGFETLQLQNAAAGTKLFTLGAYVLDGNKMAVESYTGTTTAPAAANYDILVDESAATKAVSVDLSGLTFSALKPITALDVKTGSGADTVIGANLSSGMTSIIETGAGNDTVVVGSGAGVTKVDIEAGNNTIDLTNATAANVLHFDTTATGTTTIDGWKAVTKIDFAGLGITGGTATTESITTANTNDLTANEVYFINTTGAAANFTLEGTAVITDFTSKNQVSAYLNEHFDANVTGTSNVFIFNDTTIGANKSYIYAFTDTVTADGEVQVEELSLVGIVNNAGTALNTSNYDDGAF